MDRNATSYEISDLRPYTTYTFSISAINKAGTGLAKRVSSITPEGGELLKLSNYRGDEPSLTVNLSMSIIVAGLVELGMWHNLC
jgi:hypothetical protein